MQIQNLTCPLSLIPLLLSLLMYKSNGLQSNCSVQICPQQPHNCIIWDKFCKCNESTEFNTNQRKLMAVCHIQNPQTISFALWLSYQGGLIFMGNKQKMQLDSLNPYLSTLADKELIGIANMCDKQQSKLTLNTTNLPVMKANYFMLYNSCVSDIIGDLSKWLPEVKGELKLQFNNLTKIPYFSNSSLTIGVFSNNLIQSIDAEDFRNLKSLQFLHLQNNLIKTLPEDVFNDLHQLRRLFLSNNSISLLPELLFEKNYLLEEIELMYNNISELPPSIFHSTLKLKGLNLINNKLESLPPDLTIKLSKLRVLLLAYNSISEIPEYFLQKNRRLIAFSIAYNQITYIPELLFTNTPNLRFLELNNNNLALLPKSLLDGLGGLEEIHLQNNRLVSLPKEFFDETPLLTIINLHNNSLTTLPSDILFSIGLNPSINLSNNNFTQFPYLKTDLTKFPSLNFSSNHISSIVNPITALIVKGKTIDLSNNCIQRFDDGGTIILSENGIETIECNNCCLNGDNIDAFLHAQSVILTSNNISFLNERIYNNAFKFTLLNLSYNPLGLSELEKISQSFALMSKNFIIKQPQIHCNCSLIPLIESYRKKNWNILADCWNSKSLEWKFVNTLSYEDLFCDYKDKCPHPCECRVRNSDKPELIEVDCSHKNLSYFPDLDQILFTNLTLYFNNNLISSLPAKSHLIWKKIVTLNLSYNSISSLENFTVTSSMQYIVLTNNSLNSYDQSLDELVLNNVSFNINNNPWACECQMKNVLISNVVENRENLVCKWKNEIKNFVHFTQNECTFINLLYLWILLPITMIVTLIGIGLSLFYKFKPEILFYLFSRGICLRFVTEEDVDKEYDAFISYASQDQQWVKDNLITELENGTLRYKLCVHGRDWLGGVLITDQIITSISTSRRTIMVLTENYLKSHWSRMEFDFAYQQTLTDPSHRLVAVLPGGVPDLSLIDEEFRKFIQLTTYLEFNKPYFWTKLKSSMPRRAQKKGKKKASDDINMESSVV